MQKLFQISNLYTIAKINGGIDQCFHGCNYMLAEKFKKTMKQTAQINNIYRFE